MKIIVVGTGYVGLVTGACLADVGNNVRCIDIIESKVNSLRNGTVPFYEPRLSEIVKKNLSNNRLTFDTEWEDSIHDADFIFICVGTPPDIEGKADLTGVRASFKNLLERLSLVSREKELQIVVKSTVPPGTCRYLHDTLQTHAYSFQVSIASNPEFLREGSAVRDFFSPDRVVIGASEDIYTLPLIRLYKPIYNSTVRYYQTNFESSELSKYASNTFLATKITFINEISNLCERIGADISQVAHIMGSDTRIGKEFLKAGPGFGGSCFPKDVKALGCLANELNYDFKLLNAVHSANQRQQQLAFEKIKTILNQPLSTSTITILGLSFKANTDDIRESCSLPLIDSLLESNACIQVFDPEAMDNIRSYYQNKLAYFNSPYDAANNSDIIVIMTDWNEFKELDFKRLKDTVKQPYILDMRNIYSSSDICSRGFSYFSVGRQHKSPLLLDVEKCSFD